MFKTLGKYQHLVAGAQSRPSPKVRHPLLTWHLGFWNEIEESSGETGEAQSSDAAVKVKTAAEFQADRTRYIESVRRQMNEKCTDVVHPQYAPGRGPPDEGDKLALVPTQFNWHFFKGTVHFEHHTEYFTISVLLDLSPEEGRAKSEKEDVPIELRAILDELRRLKEIVDHGDDKKFSTDYRNNFEKMSEAAFSSIWECLYREILNTSDEEIKALGGIFADFRGCVLSDRAPIPDSRRAVTRWLRQAGTPEVQEPFWREHKVLRRSLSKPPSNEDYWKRRYDLMWPLMTAKLKGLDFLEYEFTASLFAEGRALYISALGAQPQFRGPEDERIPLCFALYTHDLGGWAIGRLIEQINQQGTLRLASLYDLTGLEKAATPLREAELAVRRAFGRLIPIQVEDEDEDKEKGKDEDGSSGEPSSESEREARPPKEAVVETAGATVDPVSLLSRSQNWMAEADKKVLGGVEYRIERSRYYILRFHKGMETLQIRPFGDIQPYNAFVERRLGPAFGFIGMLSSRYERVRRDIRNLTQQCLVEAIHQRNVETKNLQRWADGIIYPVLLPYYFGTLLGYTMFGRYQHGMPVGYWFMLWPIAGLIPLLTRRHGRSWLRNLGIVSLLSLLAAIIVLRVASVPDWVWDTGPRRGEELAREDDRQARGPAAGGGRRDNGSMARPLDQGKENPPVAAAVNAAGRTGDSAPNRQKQEGPQLPQ